MFVSIRGTGSGWSQLGADIAGEAVGDSGRHVRLHFQPMARRWQLVRIGTMPTSVIQIEVMVRMSILGSGSVVEQARRGH